MALGIGPGADMMKAFKENRKHLGQGKRLKDAHEGYKADKNQQGLKFKEVNQEDLNRIKEQIREEQQRERRILAWVSAILALAGIIGIYLIVF